MTKLHPFASSAAALCAITAGLLVTLVACKGAAVECNPDDGMWCGLNLLCYECPGTDHAVCTDGFETLDQDCAAFANGTSGGSTSSAPYGYGCGSSEYGGPYYGSGDEQMESYCQALWNEGCHDEAVEYYCSVLEGFGAEGACPYC